MNILLFAVQLEIKGLPIRNLVCKLENYFISKNVSIFQQKV